MATKKKKKNNHEIDDKRTNYFKRVYITQCAIKQFDDYWFVVHEQKWRKSRLDRRDIVNVYSKKYKRWIWNAQVTKSYFDDNNVKHLIIKYSLNNKDQFIVLRSDSKYLSLTWRVHPILILIMVKSHGQAQELLKHLKALGTERIEIYESERGNMHHHLQAKIYENLINIIIFPHYKNWNRNNLSQYLDKNVDIIIKFESNVHKNAYTHYKQMLKEDTGRLIKIPLFVNYKRTPLLYIKYTLYCRDWYVTECIINWNRSMKLLSIPNDVIYLISKYIQDSFIRCWKSDEIEILTKYQSPAFTKFQIPSWADFLLH